MKQVELTIPTIEFKGYESAAKAAALNHIFNKEQLEALEVNSGRSIYFNHVATELIKRRSHDQTMTDVLRLEDPTFMKLKR